MPLYVSPLSIMWIWQQPEWPEFRYDAQAVMPHLEACIQKVAPLKVLASSLELEQRLDWESAILLDETLATAHIEGETLDRDSVRSSIANKLGVGQVTRHDQRADGLVEVLLHAIRTCAEPLTHEQLAAWHQVMFPVAPLLGQITIGAYRNEGMQVQSGRYGREKIHFIAPGENKSEVHLEMSRFLQWLNGQQGIGENSGYIRAALAKFYFVTVHPFDDGNGRLSRIIAERCLADVEQTNLRLYSLSSVIDRRKGEYYDVLERCQRGDLDVTQWVCWFLDAVAEAGEAAGSQFQRLLVRTRFWQQYQSSTFNERQLKLLRRMLELGEFADGVSRKKYRALTKTSEVTAARDLANLVEQGALVPQGEGRGRRYVLNQVSA